MAQPKKIQAMLMTNEIPGPEETGRIVIGANFGMVFL